MWGWARRLLPALAIVAIPAVSAAQLIPSGEQPGRQQERFIQPPAPQARPAGPTVALPNTVAPKGAEKIFLRVGSVQITGATVYESKQLKALYADLIGQRVPLTAVYALAQRITAKYGNDGYVLSRAVVPPQQLDPKHAIVHIEVIEGYIDKVEWPPQLSRYRDFFSYYAEKITAQRPANIRIIERYLLLAGDLPGLKFTTALRPSAEPAASVLTVQVAEKPVAALGQVDNRGTPGQGPLEYLASATFNNLLHQNEAVTFTYAGAIPFKELNYVAANYKQVLTPGGLSVFADGSYTWGSPDTAPLEALQYRTLGPYADAGMSYSLLRSRERNLTLSGLFFAWDTQSDVHDATFTDDRLRGFRARADGDFADPFQGINQLYARVSQGIEGLGSTQNGNPLASRSVGRVDFTKLDGYASHTQPLPASFSAFAAAFGQYAFTPLLVPEQCGFGGRYFGRAFYPSQFLGDSCVEATGELRYDISNHSPQFSQVQLYGFTDWGQLYTLEPSSGVPGVFDAASAGGGVRVGFFSRVNVDLSVAKAIEGATNNWRFFFIVAATY